MNYFSDWDDEDIKKYYARISKKPSKINFNNKVDKLPAQKKKSKYMANKVEVDGIKFDSQKEADYYCELTLRLKAREIRGFCRQAEFILAPNLRYKADFVVFNLDNTFEIIDVKGFKTQVYKDKKKVFEDKFDLKIKEV